MTQRPESSRKRLTLEEWQAPRTLERKRLGAPLIVRTLRAHAADRTSVGASFLGVELLLQVTLHVVEQRLFEDAARLRAPVDIAELVHVQVTAARAALEWRAARLQDPFAVIVSFTEALTAEHLLHTSEGRLAFFVQMNLPSAVM